MAPFWKAFFMVHLGKEFFLAPVEKEFFIWKGPPYFFRPPMVVKIRGVGVSGLVGGAEIADPDVAR